MSNAILYSIDPAPYSFLTPSSIVAKSGCTGTGGTIGSTAVLGISIPCDSIASGKTEGLENITTTDAGKVKSNGNMKLFANAARRLEKNLKKTYWFSKSILDDNHFSSNSVCNWALVFFFSLPLPLSSFFFFFLSSFEVDLSAAALAATA